MPDWYKLEGKAPVACSLAEWAQWYAENYDRKRVALDKIGKVKISTVFLGIDHRHYGDGDGPPVLFETMVFGGEHDQWQDRVCTWDEAEAMHAEAVRLVQHRRLKAHDLSLYNEVLHEFERGRNGLPE